MTMPQDSLHGARTAPYAVGTALATAWRIFLRNALPFLFLAAVLYGPILYYILEALDSAMTIGPDVDRESDAEVKAALTAGASMVGWVSLLMGLAANVVLGALITFGVVMELKKQHAGFGRTIAVGTRRVGPALGVFVLFAAIVYGPAILLGALRADLLLLWLAPMLFLYCMFFVSLPAAIVERPGLTGALTRSRALTDGNKAGLFTMLLAIAATYLVARLVVVQVVIGTPDTVDETTAAIRTAFIAQTVLYMLLGTFMAVVTAVSYCLLRNEKDGTTVDELARVFE